VESGNPLEILQRFTRRRQPKESCELCSRQVYPGHEHLLDLISRKLICTCDGCALLFSSRANARYRRIPRDIRLLDDFQLSSAEWEDLMIPINMAFFFRDSRTSSISALYPSPAGATESLLSLEAWNGIVQNNPVLTEIEPDVEALLVNRVAAARGGGKARYYIMPIDECYRLTGILRLHWRGLSGGAELWQEITKFFLEIDSRAAVVCRPSHA
jgi:hypothetical protein